MANFHHCDGFDHYETTLANKWSGQQQSTSTTTPFSLGRSLIPSQASGHYRQLGGNHQAVMVMFAHRTGSSFVNTNFLIASDGIMGSGGVEKVSARINATNQWEVRQGTTVLLTGPTALPNTWYHVCSAVFVSATVGAVYLWINGELVDSATGVNTAGTGNEYINTLTPNYSGTDSLIDDWIVYAGSAFQPSEFPGPLRVFTSFPSGAGALSEWDPSTSVNWQDAGETLQDEDATYVKTGTVNATDTYTHTAIPFTPEFIEAIQIVNIGQMDTSGTAKIKSAIRIGSTLFAGAEHTLDGNWKAYTTKSELNPDSGVAWTKSAVDAAQIGQLLSSQT